MLPLLSLSSLPPRPLPPLSKTMPLPRRLAVRLSPREIDARGGGGARPSVRDGRRSEPRAGPAAGGGDDDAAAAAAADDDDDDEDDGIGNVFLPRGAGACDTLTEVRSS